MLVSREIYAPAVRLRTRVHARMRKGAQPAPTPTGAVTLN